MVKLEISLLNVRVGRIGAICYYYLSGFHSTVLPSILLAVVEQEYQVREEVSLQINRAVLLCFVLGFLEAFLSTYLGFL